MEKSKCYLCKQNDVYFIKSHFTPAVITENTFGKRNAEEIFTIDTENKTIEKYVGPQNPQTEITAVKEAPNVKKGVFCKECEKKLADIESKCQSYLNETVNSLGKGGYKIYRTAQGIKFLVLNINTNILSLFYYSIIWRQGIEQMLDGKDIPLGKTEFEKLRLIVLENIYKTQKEIENSDFSKYPKLTIFTTYNTDSISTATFVNPNPTVTNPELYFAGPINILYWKDEKLTVGLEGIIGVEETLLDEELNIASNRDSRLVVLSSSQWKKINISFAKKIARKYTAPK